LPPFPLGAFRGVCREWAALADAEVCAWTPGAQCEMLGKLHRFTGLRRADLRLCRAADVSAALGELVGLPLLRELALPASCASDAVHAGQTGTRLARLTQLRRLRIEEVGVDPDASDRVWGRWAVQLRSLSASLTELDLRACAPQPGDDELRDLCSLTRLSSLRLRACLGLREAHLAELRSLSRLEQLDLGGLRLPEWRATHTLRALSASLPLLARLDLGGSLGFGGVRPLEELAGFPRLTHLGLARCEVPFPDGAAALARMPRLEVLVLDDCPALVPSAVVALANPDSALRHVNLWRGSFGVPGRLRARGFAREWEVGQAALAAAGRGPSLAQLCFDLPWAGWPKRGAVEPHAAP
jgi:hypothetical protein